MLKVTPKISRDCLKIRGIRSHAMDAEDTSVIIRKTGELIGVTINNKDISRSESDLRSCEVSYKQSAEKNLRLQRDSNP